MSQGYIPHSIRKILIDRQEDIFKPMAEALKGDAGTSADDLKVLTGDPEASLQYQTLPDGNTEVKVVTVLDDNLKKVEDGRIYCEDTFVLSAQGDFIDHRRDFTLPSAFQNDQVWKARLEALKRVSYGEGDALNEDNEPLALEEAMGGMAPSLWRGLPRSLSDATQGKYVGQDVGEIFNGRGVEGKASKDVLRTPADLQQQGLGFSPSHSQASESEVELTSGARWVTRDIPVVFVGSSLSENEPVLFLRDNYGFSSRGKLEERKTELIFTNPSAQSDVVPISGVVKEKFVSIWNKSGSDDPNAKHPFVQQFRSYIADQFAGGRSSPKIAYSDPSSGIQFSKTSGLVSLSLTIAVFPQQDQDEKHWVTQQFFYDANGKCLGVLRRWTWNQEKQIKDLQAEIAELEVQLATETDSQQRENLERDKKNKLSELNELQKQVLKLQKNARAALPDQQDVNSFAEGLYLQFYSQSGFELRSLVPASTVAAPIANPTPPSSGSSVSISQVVVGLANSRSQPSSPRVLQSLELASKVCGGANSSALFEQALAGARSNSESSVLAALEAVATTSEQQQVLAALSKDAVFLTIDRASTTQDSQYRGDILLRLAKKLAHRPGHRNPEQAEAILKYLTQATGFPPSTKEKASSQLDRLSHGDRGDQLLEMGKSLVDPVNMASMAAAPLIGVQAEKFALRRLGALAPGLRGTLASTFGILGEASAFSLTGRAGSALRASTPEERMALWNGVGLYNEVASMSTTFALLRIGHRGLGKTLPFLTQSKMWGRQNTHFEPLVFNNHLGRHFTTSVPPAYQLNRWGGALYHTANTAVGIGGMWLGHPLSSPLLIGERHHLDLSWGGFIDAAAGYAHAVAGFRITNRATGGKLQADLAKMRQDLGLIDLKLNKSEELFKNTLAQGRQWDSQAAAEYNQANIAQAIRAYRLLSARGANVEGQQAIVEMANWYHLDLLDSSKSPWELAGDILRRHQNRQSSLHSQRGVEQPSEVQGAARRGAVPDELEIEIDVDVPVGVEREASQEVTRPYAAPRAEAEIDALLSELRESTLPPFDGKPSESGSRGILPGQSWVTLTMSQGNADNTVAVHRGENISVVLIGSKVGSPSAERGFDTFAPDVARSELAPVHAAVYMGSLRGKTGAFLVAVRQPEAGHQVLVNGIELPQGEVRRLSGSEDVVLVGPGGLRYPLEINLHKSLQSAESQDSLAHEPTQVAAVSDRGTDHSKQLASLMNVDNPKNKAPVASLQGSGPWIKIGGHSVALHRSSRPLVVVGQAAGTTSSGVSVVTPSEASNLAPQQVALYLGQSSAGGDPQLYLAVLDTECGALVNGERVVREEGKGVKVRKVPPGAEVKLMGKDGRLVPLQIELLGLQRSEGVSPVIQSGPGEVTRVGVELAKYIEPAGNGNRPQVVEAGPSFGEITPIPADLTRAVNIASINLQAELTPQAPSEGRVPEALPENLGTSENRDRLMEEGGITGRLSSQNQKIFSGDFEGWINALTTAERARDYVVRAKPDGLVITSLVGRETNFIDPVAREEKLESTVVQVQDRARFNEIMRELLAVQISCKLEISIPTDYMTQKSPSFTVRYAPHHKELVSSVLEGVMEEGVLSLAEGQETQDGQFEFVDL